MTRLYHFQGPESIVQALADQPEGYPVRSGSDLGQWIQITHQQVNAWDSNWIQKTWRCVPMCTHSFLLTTGAGCGTLVRAIGG
jgi:hypothetical protein